MSSRAILCLGLNPALDVTYGIDRLEHGESQRVARVHQRAGGKATNVARIAAHLGGRPILVGAVGGAVGEEMRADLHTSGLESRLITTTRATRRTTTVVESDRTTTALNEVGEPMPAAEWDALQGAVETVLASETVGVLVLSRSLPPGAPIEAYAALVARALAHDVLSIVDCSGPALVAALAAGAAMAKPNRHELLATTGADGLAGVSALRRHGRNAWVVASDGPAGVLCAGPGSTWRATPAQALVGNPTGAGDALVAALAVGMIRGDTMADRLCAAVGASGAAVLDPVAGHIDPAVAATLAASVVVEQIA